MMRTTLWILFFVILIEVVINSIFKIPYPYKFGGQLANYFNYGRSVESKVIRLVADSNENAHMLAKVGWFKNREEYPELYETNQSGRNVYVYGMSFSSQIGTILGEIDPGLNIRLFDGPGAPLNHSYAYYEYTRPHKKGDIVILGILASSLPLINTMSVMTANFEIPSPHFYPRYRIGENNEIVKDDIGINSLRELRGILQDKESWEAVKEYLAEKDSFYDPVIFEKNLLDHSVYCRLAKRAWGQRSLNRNSARYHDVEGFKNEDRMVDLSRLLVSKFVNNARLDGAIPYVILFNDRGYDDHLYQLMKPVLDGENIPYFSTHEKYPAANLANFIPDGHFRPEIDIAMAEEIYRHLSKIQD